MIKIQYCDLNANGLFITYLTGDQKHKLSFNPSEACKFLTEARVITGFDLSGKEPVILNVYELDINDNIIWDSEPGNVPLSIYWMTNPLTSKHLARIRRKLDNDQLLNVINTTQSA
jgi:hypothetical protein